MAGAVKFRFSSEELRGEPPAHDRAVAPTEGMLDEGRFGERTEYLTEARRSGISWVPELGYSVITQYASTFSCFCCGRWSRLGCTRPYTLFGCTLYSMGWTRAQWIWLLNLLCLIVHATFAFLCFTSCNSWRFGVHVNQNCTAEGMTVRVQRFAINWTDTTANGYAVGLIDNGKPIRFDYLTASFFLLSAIFHGLAVLVGPFDRFAWAYWKQLDNALCWWYAQLPTPLHFLLSS